MRTGRIALPMVCTALALLVACRADPETDDPAAKRIASADHLVVIEKEELGTQLPSRALLRSLGVHVGPNAPGRTGSAGLNTHFEEIIEEYEDDVAYEGKQSNAAIGLGGGAGTFGGRGGMRRRYGQGGTSEAVEVELSWLARHQKPEEGCWDAAHFREQCLGNICNCTGRPEATTACTALALLKLLGDGYTHQAGLYKKNVGEAIKYLRRIQDGDGCFGPRTGPYLYGHACATLAMVEAYGLSNSPLLRRPAEKAVVFLCRVQNDDSTGKGKLAWGDVPRCARNNLVVTTFALMALKSARAAGLEIPGDAFDGARTWLARVTDASTGTVRSNGDDSGGGLPVASPEARTAMGAFARVLLGEDPATSPVVQKGTDRLLARLPHLESAKGSGDDLAWYFGTLALYQVGGQPWAKWNKAVKKAIVDHQRKDGCEKGSFGPDGPWATFGGRIHATALRGITVSVYYRSGRAIGTRYAGGAFTPEPQDAAPAAPGIGGLHARGAGLDAAARFPLEHTAVEAEVAGWLATTRVTQTFGNPFTQTVEAVYVFPLPTTAAVNDFVMEIRGRRIVGVVRPREEARRIYRQARARGQTASLLTQERPNVFTQNVANIEPGGRVDVHITYFHPLEYENGSYEYVFPMTVGPRYMPGRPAATPGATSDAAGADTASPAETGGGTSPDTDQVPDASRISPPTLPPGVRSGHDVSLRLTVEAGVPIAELASPTHDVSVVRRGSGTAVVELAPHDTIPNRDFVLRWRVAGAELRAGCVAHRSPRRGGFFSAFVIPVLNPSDADLTPREVTFVLDTSGSMRGLPLELSRQVARRTLKGLRPYDRFNIIRFAGSSGSMAAAPVPATPENRRQGLAYLDALRGAGGTEMLSGIRSYLAQPRESQFVRYVCFLTDGFVGNEDAILAMIRKHGQDARWFAFGIGSSVNRFLVEGVAEHGRGICRVVLTRDAGAAEKAAEQFLAHLDAPQLVDVTLDVSGLPVTDVYPKEIPDLVSGRPIRLTGRYTAPAEGRLIFRARLAGRRVMLPVAVTLPAAESRHAALAPMWARARIADLSKRMLDRTTEAESAALKRQITDTAVDFRLVSRYTAFVAVDESRIVGDGRPTRMLQPVALADGVSYEGAVGPRTARLLFEAPAWGVTLRELPNLKLMVQAVAAGGAADQAGVRPGDELFALGRNAVIGTRHLESLLLQTRAGRVAVGFRPAHDRGEIRRAVLPRP